MQLQILAFIFVLGTACEALEVPLHEAANYKYLALQMMNEIRTNHSSLNLTLDHKLCHQAVQCATNYANKIAEKGSCGVWLGFGETHYSRVKSRNANDTIRKAIELWYDYRYSRYNYKNPGFKRGYRAFAQIVWASSTRFGCGVQSANNKTYAVCLYDPPGNTPEEPHDKSAAAFRLNVNRPSRTEYQILALKLHNTARARHNSAPMKTNKTLNKWAEKCVEDYGKKADVDGNIPFNVLCQNKHKNIGETITFRNERVNPIEMIQSHMKFYYDSQYMLYDYSRLTYNSNTLYKGFIQVLWNKSIKLGCWVRVFEKEKRSRYPRTWCVCLYDPAAGGENTPDEEFRENVKPPNEQKQN